MPKSHKFTVIIVAGDIQTKIHTHRITQRDYCWKLLTEIYPDHNKSPQTAKMHIKEYKRIRYVLINTYTQHRLRTAR